MRAAGALAAAAMSVGFGGYRLGAPEIPNDGRVHFTSEKPLTKRQKRRQRGKGRP